MRRIFITLTLIASMFGTPAMAQLGLPGGGLGGLGGTVGGVLDPVIGTVRRTTDGVIGAVEQIADRLAQKRIDRIGRLLRDNRDTIALDRMGNPARQGELLIMDASEADIALAVAAGFVPLGSEAIEGLSLTVVRLGLPDDTTLADAHDRLTAIMPGAIVTADVLHFTAGGGIMPVAAASAAIGARIDTPVGMIDGAPGKSVAVAAQRGFAKGAPVASNHGSAVASLLKGAGVRSVRVADVYGTDPAGGNALAIARGLGWLIEGGATVVTISLVGPESPLLARAIAAAQKRGTVVVAAVGNDGPASPASYPASYDGVIAVTGVDRHDRALIEAGKALHLDYAAPGADIYGVDRKGGRLKLRGTSFATPLAAARIAAAVGRGRDWRALIDGEARDLGRKGPDDQYGRGLLCSPCAGRK